MRSWMLSTWRAPGSVLIASTGARPPRARLGCLSQGMARSLSPRYSLAIATMRADRDFSGNSDPVKSPSIEKAGRSQVGSLDYPQAAITADVTPFWNARARRGAPRLGQWRQG